MSYGTHSEDTEVAVIEHPLQGVPDDVKHAHHKREILIKKDAPNVTLEPILKQPNGQIKLVGEEGRYTYTRTTDVDGDGRAIFR